MVKVDALHVLTIELVRNIGHFVWEDVEDSGSDIVQVGGQSGHGGCRDW